MGRALLDLYLSVSSHLNAGVQELVKVLTEFARGHSKLAAGATWWVHHFSSRMVQLSSCVVQVSLSLLEWLGAWRQLHRDTEAETVLWWRYVTGDSYSYNPPKHVYSVPVKPGHWFPVLPFPMEMYYVYQYTQLCVFDLWTLHKYKLNVK